MSEKKDIFYLDKVYPDAAKIFSEDFKHVNEIINSAIIVLDTNVLLVPFDTNEENVADIVTIYAKYKATNRLFISTRTAREFANNRASKIGGIFLQLRQIKDSLNAGNFNLNQYPILENSEDYNLLKEEFSAIQSGIKKSRKFLENLEAFIQGWTWNDNVSTAYKDIFTQDIIIDVKKSNAELEKDLAFRIEHKVAPGYKDSNKPDDGIGDLIIWQTILEIARDNNKDVIFVTNDQKNDWFYKQDKLSLYPKYELFDEFRRFTNGKSISIINFVKFLELSQANITTIEQVKNRIQANAEALERDRVEAQQETTNSFVLNPKHLRKGMRVDHQKFGLGVIISISKYGNHDIAEVSFLEHGTKKLMTQYTRLRILDDEAV